MADDIKLEPAARELVKMEPNEQVEHCRFYEERLPALEQSIVARVKSITETAAYVVLLEYGNIEGMIPLSELSRRRIRSVNKHIRVGKTEVLQVIRVDTEKGYIDLSKSKVTPEEIKPAEMRYNKAKDVHSILRHVAEECRIKLDSLYRAVSWPLSRKYGNAFDAFGMAVQNPEKILLPLQLPSEVYNALVHNIKHRHKAQPFRIRADIEVTCFTYEGIDAIREALLIGKAAGSDEGTQIAIKLLAAPTYVIVAQAIDKDSGLGTVQKMISTIKGAIEERKGNLKITKDAGVVSSMEDEIKSNSEGSDEEEESENEGEDDDA